ARMIRFSGVERVRPGGVVDVVDAVEHFRTIDTRDIPPARYRASSLVVVNKTDLLPAGDRDRVLARVAERVGAVNPRAQVVTASRGRLDPALVYDAASREDPQDELPIAALMRDEHAHDHPHADAVSVRACAAVSPSRLVDLLEEPPAGAYRIKGRVTVHTGRTARGYLVNVVGRSVHVASVRPPDDGGELVAIGLQLDTRGVRRSLEYVLEPTARPDAGGFARLQRYRRLSV